MQEIITIKDIQDMYLETEHGMFTPLYEYKLFDAQTQTYQGFVLIKTAEEVYNEWLETKDKPVVVKPTTEQLLTQLIINQL